MTHYCKGCSTHKNISDFEKSQLKYSPNGARCKICRRKQYKKYYHKNKDKESKRTIRHKNLRRDCIYDYLLGKHCEACNETNIILLEFHHFKNKVNEISKMISSSSIDKILYELDKCEILCANCHLIKTHDKFDWYNVMKHSKCSRCNKNKPVTSFGKSKKGINRWCKVCHSEYNKDRDKRRKEIQNDNKRIRKYIGRKFLLEYLRSHPCINCGESNPIVLGFHHKSTKNKKSNVSAMIQNGRSINSLKEEIDKCTVLCANCHKIITAKQLGWYKNHKQYSKLLENH